MAAGWSACSDGFIVRGRICIFPSRARRRVAHLADPRPGGAPSTTPSAVISRARNWGPCPGPGMI
eukprot:15455421-Alexandrium_andersonii.AAC.1